jgi:Asp-tRNA(Asn)/Glu-tRNA(Gln) amidotransferase C subunit
MATPGGDSITPEEFKRLTEQAGLGLSDEELEKLRPLYELHLPYLAQLHSIDFKSEEISLAFHPDWPSP